MSYWVLIEFVDLELCYMVWGIVFLNAVFLFSLYGFLVNLLCVIVKKGFFNLWCKEIVKDSMILIVKIVWGVLSFKIIYL